jgi:APA family basic amino acid/polyamine antiporter
MIGASTVALGFGGYFNALFNVPVEIGAIFLLVSLSFIIFLGIRESAWFAIVATLIEAGGLVLIIFIGLPYFGNVDYFKMPQGLKGVFEASALIFFAYIGFEGIVKLSEETKSPEKTIPKGLMLAIFISIVLYILVAVSAVSVMGWERLSKSDAPFADLAFNVLGSKASAVLSVIALFATANTVLMMQLASSRITYGMADSFSLPGMFAALHPSRRTPWVAILSMTLLSMVFVFAGDIELVANVTNFTLFVTFIVINATLILLRYREPGLKRPFRVPLTIGKFPVLPLFGLAFCIFMLSQLNAEVLLIGAMLILLGGLFSLMNVKKLGIKLTADERKTL